ncbi:MAG: asparagine synthase [Thaumarchaeota archaeon]|nr:asparagine synthase [Nitrososphaerota archaeon]
MRVNPASISSILTLRYNPIKKSQILPRVWQDFREKHSANQIGYVEETLQNTIKKHIRKTRAKKVSIALSGGIDSTLVLLMLKKAVPDISVEAISVKFSDSFDESTTARKIAERLGAEHNTLYLENYLEELPKAISIIKEPFWDLHWYYLAKKSKTISNVLLSGDGGDELFGGYTFRYEKFLSSVEPNFTSLDKAKLYLMCHERDWVPDQEKLFGHKIKFSWDNIYDRIKEYFDNPLSSLSQVFLADFNGKLLYNWIPLYSKIHKYFGIDSLSPILSKEMIYFAIHLENKLKYDNKSNLGKILLRKILSKYGISSLILDEKRGFSVNTLKLWKSHGFHLCDYYLSKARIIEEGLINQEWTKKYISKRYDLDIRYVNKFFGLLALEIWFRLFVTKEMNPNAKLS